MIKKQIGNCTLYCGDCNNILPTLGAIDSLITDPPYKMEIHGRGFASKRDYYKQLDYGTSTEFELKPEFYEQILDILNEKNIVIFCNKLMKLDILNWAVSKGFMFDELPLCKTSPAPLTNNQWLPDKEWAVHIFKDCVVKGSYATKQSWFMDTNYKSDIKHPSVKPLYILERIIKNVTIAGDTVLDTFMGSGTTGVACAKLGRKFIGIEIDKAHFTTACDRIQAIYDEPDMFGHVEDHGKQANLLE